MWVICNVCCQAKTVQGWRMTAQETYLSALRLTRQTLHVNRSFLAV